MAMTSPLFLLESTRVKLRQVQMQDVQAIVSYRSLPEIACYQSWTIFEMADARHLVAVQAQLEPDTPGSWFQLVIVENTSDAIIGDLALHFNKDDERQVELGINMAPPYQGKGLAAEAMRCVLDHLFLRMNKHRVYAITDAANKAARDLLLRVGFRQEGHLVEHVMFKGRHASEYLFALLAREWQSGLEARGL